jgi:glutathione synthase/RimK-type ligase-like ATP-grasp enzyme
MKPIALATSSKYPNLTDDDRFLLGPLVDRGIQAEPAVWNDPSHDWSSNGAVVIRSCWDYHFRPEGFLRWIADLEAANIPIFNRAPLIRWNADKTYLRDLEARNIAIVPTFWAEDNGAIRLEDKLREFDWPKAVVKPRISATAYRTQLVTAADAAVAQPLFDDLRRGPGVMLQKFMDSIASEGEWSVIFFDGAFSHAVLKKPKPGDFRVQSDFGGSAQLTEPPEHVLSSATQAVEAVAPTLYARVDGVVDEGKFRLMELELIEPALFLGDHPQAPARFANAIAGALSEHLALTT